MGEEKRGSVCVREYDCVDGMSSVQTGAMLGSQVPCVCKAKGKARATWMDTNDKSKEVMREEERRAIVTG